MNSFEERQKGFEAAFKRDQDLSFRITARRNKLFGLWAAERLGLSLSDAEAYAKTVVAADLEAPGDADVIAKVHSDLNARGVDCTEAELQSELMRFIDEARRQIVQAPGEASG